MGYLPENVSFYDAMTVEEHLRYFAGLKGVARPRIDELVEELGSVSCCASASASARRASASASALHRRFSPARAF